jgi:uncharacterized protein (DUF1810 family)
MTKFNLQRFVQAQKKDYQLAKQELENGRKQSHWIWYIFPQLKGLGRSRMSQKYDIENGDEACAYLDDPILFERLHELLSIVKQQLEKGVSLVTLFNGKTDAYKFTSSITLFNLAAKQLSDSSVKPQKFKLFLQQSNEVLDIIQKQNFNRCQYTIDNAIFSSKMVKNSLNQESGSSIERQEMPLHTLVNRALNQYIQQRSKEPEYWYQGIFRGYSKRDKLRASISFYLLINGKEKTCEKFREIIQKNGFKLSELEHWNPKTNTKILTQGRVGRQLHQIAKSASVVLQSNVKRFSSDNTAAHLIHFLEVSSIAGTEISTTNKMRH